MATALPARIFPASQALSSAGMTGDGAPIAAVPARALKPSLLRRLFDAMVQSQTRRAEREIARFLAPDALAALHRRYPPQR